MFEYVKVANALLYQLGLLFIAEFPSCSYFAVGVLVLDLMMLQCFR